MTDDTDTDGSDDGPDEQVASSTAETQQRCDFCRLQVPDDPVRATLDGSVYTFCCEHCRSAMESSDRVFTEYRGYRHFRSSVSVLDAQLPQGLLRNSFVLFSGQAGTREDALYAELIWRTLRRGEPAMYVTFQEPPTSVVERFLTLDWNVLPDLERGDLHIVDCFTYRVDDRDRMYENMNDWNQHIYDVAEDETTAVRDPSEVSAIESRLDNCLDAMGMVDTGVVLIDSLTEFGSLVQPVQAYNFVRDIRADICKGRFIPIFAGASVVSESDEFPHDLGYIVDGVVDLRLNPELIEDTLIKQIRVRKMNGVLSIPEWTAYEFTSGQGLVMFDPHEEIEKKREERVEDAPTDGEAAEPTDDDPPDEDTAVEPADPDEES
ncbi:MAG: ATPase domain-containing protein [Halobacteriales archaeon]